MAPGYNFGVISMPKGPYFKVPMQKTGWKNLFRAQNEKTFNFQSKNGHFSVRRHFQNFCLWLFFVNFLVLNLTGCWNSSRTVQNNEKLAFTAWKNLIALARYTSLKNLTVRRKQHFLVFQLHDGRQKCLKGSHIKSTISSKRRDFFEQNATNFMTIGAKFDF